jgi:hypothetical protein
MANETTVHGALSEPVGFEWQQSQQVIKVPAKLVDSPGTPSPKLRCNVVDTWYLSVLDAFRNSVCESGRINRHQSIRLHGINRGGCLTHTAKELSGVGEDLDDAHYRKLRHWKQAFQALLLHCWAADPSKGNGATGCVIQSNH